MDYYYADDMELQITKLFQLLVFKLQNIPKVFNSKEVGEVQEGADCYCDKKLSKHC